MGRPSDYSEATVAAICDRLVQGDSLLKICKDEGMPDRVTIYRWLEKHDGFRNKYARAREAMMDYYADLIRDIAFDDSGDFFIEDGRTVADHARVQRARLKVDALKWIASKLAPRQYGDKPVVEQQPEQLKVSWIVTGVPRAGDPPAPPRPPAQITYDPGPLPKRIDPEIIARFLRMIKDTVPRADQRSPEEVLTLALDVCERALKAEFATAAEDVSARIANYPR